MRILHLNLKKQWFDAIKSGQKTEEYRLRNDYWKNRLIEKSNGDLVPEFDRVCIKCGYPAKSDLNRIMVFECKGIIEQCISHPEFGYGVQVYAIKLGDRIQ